MAEGTKLGILLTTSPEHEDMHTVKKICEAALASGKEVHVFMMCDGAYGAYCTSMTDLMPKGVNIALCHHNAEERHVQEEKLPTKSASQYFFLGIIDDTDRLITFC